MKFSAFLPYIPAGEVLQVARVADECGYDAAALPDCVFHPQEVTGDYPYTEDGIRHWPVETAWLEPYVAIPAMAAVTKNLSFFTAVHKTILRQPLLLAKTLGTAAAMFPGRIAIGVGTSWMKEEFDWLSEDMPSRGARLNEIMDIIRICNRPGWAEYHGKHYNFEKLVMNPIPDGPIPIYVGGHAAPARRRAAQLGDGWIPAFINPEEFKGVIPEMQSMRADSPMAGKPFEVIACTMEWPTVDQVRRLEEVGVTGINIRPYADDADLQAKCDGVKRYAEEVIQAVKAT